MGKQSVNLSRDRSSLDLATEAARQQLDSSYSLWFGHTAPKQNQDGEFQQKANMRGKWEITLLVMRMKGFPGNSVVKEMWVQYLGREDPLQQEMATHSHLLAWEIPGLAGYSPRGCKRIRHNLLTEKQQT